MKSIAESVSAIESSLSAVKTSLKVDVPHAGAEKAIQTTLDEAAVSCEAAARRVGLIYEDEKKTIARQKAREAEEKASALRR